MSDFQIRALPNMGAEVGGLNLGEPIGPATADRLYKAWLRYGLLLFREAGITEEIHLSLSRVFGTLDEHVVKKMLVKENPNLIFLGSEDAGTGPAKLIDGEKRAGFTFFHHDTHYNSSMPKGAVLRMMKVPERGGDTIWTDTIAAYQALPSRLKDKIDTLETLHGAGGGLPVKRLWGWSDHKVAYANDLHEQLNPTHDRPLRVEPMVIAHPETGQKALLLSPLTFIRVLGMGEEEGDELHEEIVTFALQQEFTYQHNWSPHDMIAWDNRRTMHCALGYPYEQTRFAYRTTLGEAMSVGRLYEGQFNLG